MINDAFGHDVGDELLKEASKILLKHCIRTEFVVRWGGDEFLIVMPNSDHANAEKLIKEIKEDCLNYQIRGIEVSISFGVATQLYIEEDVRGILKQAEDHMYSSKTIEGKSMRSNALQTIMATLHEKCPRERDHSLRVGTICHSIGAMMSNHDMDIERLQMSGYLHDIGKIIIEEKILNKPDLLTIEEYGFIKKHSEIGCRILNASSEMEDIAEAVLHHYERWDGTGYPKGLKGEQIPICSRIIAIADTFDAMTSLRPYRDKSTIYEAATEIILNSGTQFDPDIAKIFIEQVVGLTWEGIEKSS